MIRKKIEMVANFQSRSGAVGQNRNTNQNRSKIYNKSITEQINLSANNWKR